MKKVERYPGNVWPAILKLVKTPKGTDMSVYRAIYALKESPGANELITGFPIDATIDTSGDAPLLIAEVPGTITANLTKKIYWEAWSLIIISNGKERTIARRRIEVEKRFFPPQNP